MKRDLSGLPTVARVEGKTPSDQPFYAPRLAEAWAKTLGDTSLPMAYPEARIRHSWAGMCARKIGYMMTDVEPSNPITIAEHWRFGIGTAIHEKWQEVMADAFPSAEIEKKVWIEACQSAGHIDLFLPDDASVMLANFPGSTMETEPITGSVCVELKSINGWGFKMAMGSRGAAEGPRTSALVQGALNGYASGANEVIIIYLSLENLSPREALKFGPEPWRKFSAEWHYPAEEFMPIAIKEINRFKRIIEIVDSGELPARSIPYEIPAGARIQNPKTGTWALKQSDVIVDTGTAWNCGYCEFQDKCASDI